MNEIKNRFHISSDELEHRMQLQQTLHEKPVKKAVLLLEVALDKVLTRLGVNIELGGIPAQQDALGIVVTEETRDEFAGLQGFFVFIKLGGDFLPIAHVGNAKLNHLGECSVGIHWLQDEKLDEIGGIKLV